MKTFLFLPFILFSYGINISAHPGGHGGGPQLVADCKISKECSVEEIRTASTKVFKFLNESYRLPVEWKEVTDPIWTKNMAVDSEIVWVTAFENQKPTAPKDKNLYIVISQDGFLMGVTNDGSKFSPLKDYKWIWGIGLIIIVSGLALVVIRQLEKKPAA